jgi:hypothetical protein
VTTDAEAARRSRRRRVLVLGAALLIGLVAGVALLASRRSPDVAGPTAAATRAAATRGTLTVVPMDAAAAARVPVTGATPLQLQTTRDVLAALGARPGIARVAFDDRGPPVVANGRRQREIVVVASDTGPLARWLAQIAAAAVVMRLGALGDVLTWISYADGGQTVDGVEAADAGAGVAAATAAGRTALESASRAGFDADVTVYPIGAIATVLHLDERGFFAPRRTDWMHITGDSGDRTIKRFVSVEAPDGTRVFTSGFGACYACGAAHVGPTPDTPLPVTMAGPTELTVDLASRLPAKPTVRVAIDCRVSTALCDTIVRDRYALIEPQVSDTGCIGGVSGPLVQIAGMIGGVRVQTTYDICSAAAAKRWVEMLRDAGAITGRWMTDD